ncbi:hypothetical protein CHS0354_006128 [Potamilus streckersoni]|uniref:Death domain-containing protein n=1 Tax=Potamilus streckersoni TaxID=2493646 RepID=A0AAE0STA8_9BIVA|nr:hypothetical protein CHS0354_006128 [Potamilus streckersoni]
MDEKRLAMQLKKYSSDFVNKVDPEELLPYLSCLTQASKEEIRAKQNNKGKITAAQDLQYHVVRYGERGIRELLRALRNENIGLVELADLIDPPLAKDNTAVTTVQMVQKDTARRPGVDEKIRKTFDRDTPLRHLPSSVYRVLRLLDSNDQIENWESLAGNIVGYTVEDICRFRQNPHYGSPMIALYNDWMTRESSTLGHLMQILIKIERVDVYTELTEITGYQHQEDNGKQTGRHNYPLERLPDPVNAMENMGPIQLDPRQGEENRIEKKGDLPDSKQHIGRGPSGPGKDNSVQNGGKKHAHEILYKRYPEQPINHTENAGPMSNSPKQGKDNRMEKKEPDLPTPERHISRGGSGSGEGIDKNENDLMNKNNVKRNSVESTEISSKVLSHEKDTEHVICSVVKANIEKVIVGALDEHPYQIEEQDSEDHNMSTESEESNSRVDSSPSNHTLHVDPWNNYKEFHKEKHHNKDVLTSEMRKEEENKINKVEQQDYKSDEGQLDQKVHDETPFYEMVPSPKDASCSVMSEEEDTSGDSKQMNERKKYTDETLENGQCVPVLTERVSMETNKPMTSTLEFQVFQKGKNSPDEHMIEREQEPSTAKERFTNGIIDQMSGGQDGKQSPKSILNEQVAGIKEVRMTSSLLPEAHKDFGSLGFVPMTIEEDHNVANQGITFSHDGDTIAHQGNASSQQNNDSYLDAEEENTHGQQHIVHAEPVDIPAAQKDTNVKRDSGFQAMDDIQVLQSSSVQGGNSSEQQNDINGCNTSTAKGWYFIIGLGIIIGACFIVRRVKKSS